jgi:hypothetical protein
MDPVSTEPTSLTPAGAEEVGSLQTLSQVVSIVSGLVSTGMNLQEIFGGGSGLDVDKLAKMLADEVRAVFEHELTVDKVREATASEKTGVQFLNGDYQAAVNAGEPDSELYDLLDDGRGGGHLNELQRQINVIEEWSHSGEFALAQQILSLYILLSSTVMGWYQEMARRSTGTKRAAAIDTIKLRSKDYAATALTIAEEVHGIRAAAITGLQRDYYPYRETVRRTWFDDTWGTSPRVVASTVRLVLPPYGEYKCPDPVGAGTWLRDKCLHFLRHGGDPQAILNEVAAKECFQYGKSAPDLDWWLRTPATSYRTWLTDCLASVQALKDLETKPLG